MKKFIIPIIFLIVIIPFVVSYLIQSSQVEVEKTKKIDKELNEKEEAKNSETNSDGYDEGGFGGSRYHEIKNDIPNKTYEEILREDAERERKRALGIKENLEWLQEDVDIDYVNQEKLMVEPFETIREEDVGWDIQNIDTINFYNLEKINNYLPVQLKVEQIAKGFFQEKINSIKISVPSGKKVEFNANPTNKARVEPNSDNIRIFIFFTFGVSGTLALSGNDLEGYEGYVEGGGIGGRHIIKLDKEGKGYVYNIFN
jgi:hypothetical protein